VVEEVLRAQFNNKIGEDKTIAGQYHILDSKNRHQIITKEHWSRSVKPGALLVMSMIMSHLRTNNRSCSRASCSGSTMVKDDTSDMVTWYLTSVA